MRLDYSRSILAVENIAWLVDVDVLVIEQKYKPCAGFQGARRVAIIAADLI
jgi:hypothetical protein